MDKRTFDCLLAANIIAHPNIDIASLERILRDFGSQLEINLSLPTLRYSSRKATYLFNHDGEVLNFKFKDEFQEKYKSAVRSARKTHEGYSNYLTSDDEIRNTTILLTGHYGPLKIMTETTTDLYPRHKVAKWELARFDRNEKGFFLSITERDFIGINPNFLYKLGEKFGKEVDLDISGITHERERNFNISCAIPLNFI